MSARPEQTREPAYTLLPPTAPPTAPTLDEQQRRVVEHPGGPLLVLAGPGTGKTTTLVETIVERIEGRGADPASVLALTFSRKAAEQLRDRVTARVGRTTSTAMCSTFHSFAYALIRKYAPAELYVAPLRLLSAPEQDVVLRELLTETPESVRWPESLGRALGTRGFAREVHDVLSRAREKGLDGPALSALGREHDLPEFVAAGLFLDQYLTVLDSQGATDYADLIRRAVIEAESHRAELRARFRHVFVDEYQDTDPGQVALLRALAGTGAPGDGRELVVVGDPHQSIYAFRGAEVRGILDFPREMTCADGSPAPVVALRTTRRFGPRLLTATQRVARRLPLTGSIPEAARGAFLAPVAAADEHGDGRAEVCTYDTDRAEAEHLADLLRRAHLEDGIGWDEMAVLVRSGRSQLPSLRRSLLAAGVPVEVAGDDLPLVQDPAAAPLLDALRAALNLHNDDPGDIGHVDAARAESLLMGPLGGLDAADVRRLARRLRARERATDERPTPSPQLVRRAVLEDGFLDGVDSPEATKARALNALLVSAAAQVAAGGTAEEVLWTLWSSTGWPRRLRTAAERGGGTARRAHRDLDSVVALFEAAARAEEQRDHQGVRNFLATLAAQQIPGDTLAERGVRGAAVRLLTAHRSKGLEWRLVVVAHVQAESWPDLQRRATLLRADRIGAHGLVPPVSTRELLAEERRLFYVACTRARERLVVTAVASSDDDGEQPSRFLDELGVEVRHVQGRPPRPLSLAGLVAELRRTVADPETSSALRAAAARRLARLADEHVGERPLVPQADPASWWGTRAQSAAGRPLRDPDGPVPVSASVLESVSRCPMRWFLEREAGGVQPAAQAASVGQLVHALADRVARGDISPEPDGRVGIDALMAQVDAVWERFEFRTPWSRDREHARIRLALERFLDWHYQDSRRLLGTETRFSTEVELASGERVRLSGFADRLEVDRDERVVVVDFKTNRNRPSNVEVTRNLQLALYQYAVDAGAVEELHPDAHSGGAELVQLGSLDESEAAVVQPQPAPAADGPDREALREQLELVARTLRSEVFWATPGDFCRTCAFVAICPAKGAGSVVSQ
ncbi:ATP-dependent helicase [Nocardioides terrisoli]|uniref:ATP-dependent helicase n=1 Tax=Nocardioides terrisoli TaxID=3388267 RepID=UPI00287BA1D7|nr:ATP-dependent DNA helicase [Nocardioides marmorisolisilvae]